MILKPRAPKCIPQKQEYRKIDEKGNQIRIVEEPEQASQIENYYLASFRGKVTEKNCPVSLVPSLVS